MHFTMAFTCGMFISSMKTIRRLPGGGPYVSLVRFSTFASKLRCTSSDVVRLEKFMFSSSCKSKDQSIQYKNRKIYFFNCKDIIINKFSIIENLGQLLNKEITISHNSSAMDIAMSCCLFL